MLKSENIEVKFEDFHGAVDIVDRYSKEKNHTFTINELKSFIRFHFLTAAELLNILDNNILPQINIVINVITFLKNENEGTLAYFSTLKSNNALHHYAIYLDYALKEYTNNKITNPTNIYNVWIHEIIHGLDFYQIQLAGDALQKIKRENNNNDLTLKYQSIPSLPFFLNILNKYRVEGFATLIESVKNNSISNNKIKLKHIDKDKFNSVLSIVGKNVPANEPGLLEENKAIMDYVTGTSYKLGKILFLNALSYFDQSNEIRYDKILKNLDEDEDEETVPIDIGIDIIERGKNLSLPDFIYANCQPFREPLFPLIYGDFIFYLLGIFLNRDSLQDENFLEEFKALYKAINNKSPNTFLQVLKGIMGYPLDEMEIEEAISNLPLKEEISHLSNYSSTLNKVYERWKLSKSELLLYTLTYALDENDIFYDSIPLIGLLDDMLILEAGLMFTE